MLRFTEVINNLFQNCFYKYTIQKILKKTTKMNSVIGSIPENQLK